jgi:hypothetical protein
MVMVEIGGSGHLIPTVDFVQISTQPVLSADLTLKLVPYPYTQGSCDPT